MIVIIRLIAEILGTVGLAVIFLAFNVFCWWAAMHLAQAKVVYTMYRVTFPLFLVGASMLSICILVLKLIGEI